MPAPSGLSPVRPGITESHTSPVAPICSPSKGLYPSKGCTITRFHSFHPCPTPESLEGSLDVGLHPLSRGVADRSVCQERATACLCDYPLSARPGAC